MREPIRDKGRLEHIAQAIEHVLDYMAGKSFDELSENKIGYYGIIKCIEIQCDTSWFMDTTK